MRRSALIAFLLFAPLFSAAATCVDIARSLSLDSTGQDVAALQQFLSENAGYTGQVTGHYGTKTAQAVGRWQIQKRIVTSAQSEGFGSVGAKTQAMLTCTSTPASFLETANPVLPRDLSIGSNGPDVGRLQNLLAWLGLFTDVPTGYFGPQTASAVKKFQDSRGIEPLGSAGPKTRAVIVTLLPPEVFTPTSTPALVQKGNAENGE